MKQKLILIIDVAELAVRMCEASYGLQRPDGLDARQALTAMDSDVRGGWERAAAVACNIFQETVEKAMKLADASAVPQ